MFCLSLASLPSFSNSQKSQTKQELPILQYLTNDMGRIIVFAFVCLLSLSLALRYLGEYGRRHFFGRKRAKLIESNFQDFCYQPFAIPQDIFGLENFPEIVDKFKFSINQLMLGSRPEIYDLITDQQDGLEISVFDLRTPMRGVGDGRASAHTGTVFLICLPEKSLTTFYLRREGFGDANLWGQDPDIDIEDEFIFSQNFHLTGPDREGIRKLFDKQLISFFRTNTNLFTAGNLDVQPRAILFRHQLRLGPEEIRSTLATLSRLLTMLTL